MAERWPNDWARGKEPPAPDVLSAGRQKCYKARDTFYECVDRLKGTATPTEIGSAGLLYPATCKAARQEYVASCRSTWVSHFDRLYGAKRRIEDRVLHPPSTPSSPDPPAGGSSRT